MPRLKKCRVLTSRKNHPFGKDSCKFSSKLVLIKSETGVLCLRQWEKYDLICTVHTLHHSVVYFLTDIFF